MKIFFLLGAIWGLVGCGVRGDPMPPGTPAEIGRGRPTYRNATENMRVPIARPTPEDDQESEGRSDESE